MSHASRFFRWVRETLDTLCDRPDHLQRLSAIGAGMTVGIFIGALISILVWFGKQSAVLALTVVPILGNALYGFIAAFIICVLVIISLVKGLGAFKVSTPSGHSFEIETTEKVKIPRGDRDVHIHQGGSVISGAGNGTSPL